MKKIIVILLALFIVASCKAKKGTPISFNDNNLQGYVQINNINIKNNNDTIHFDIEVETEDNFTALVYGAGDSIIKQFFTLQNGEGTCSFDIQNDEWSEETQLFFKVYKDDNDFFELTINKNNLNVLKSFTYISKKEKPVTLNAKFYDDNLKAPIFVKDLTVTDNADSYKFHLEINGRSNMGIFAYDNPNGDVIKKEFGTIESNEGLIDFNINKDILNTITELDLLIGDDENCLIIGFDPNNLDEIEHITYGSNEFDIINFANIDTSAYRSNFVFNSLTCEKQDDCYIYRVNATSDEVMDILIFDSPDGKIYRQKFSKAAGNDILEFEISSEQIKKFSELCVAYSADGFGEAFISFWTNEIY